MVRVQVNMVWFILTDNDLGKKLKVEIKPLSPSGSKTSNDNVDDIRTSVGMLRLSPTAGVSSNPSLTY